jgi:hypothetical protein
MNEYDQARLKVVKEKLDMMAACDIKTQQFEATALLGYLQGFVESWYGTTTPKPSPSPASDPLSYCCKSPINDLGFCEDCGEQA